MTLAPEVCTACHFDAADYDVADALGTLRAIAPMWRQSIEGVDPGLLLVRPEPAVWSAAEYAAHSADVTQAMGRLLHGLLTIDDLEAEAVPEQHSPDVSRGFDAALDRLEANLSRLHGRAERVGGDDEDGWRRTASVDGHTVDGAWVLRHAVHDAVHHLRDIARGLVALGAGVASQRGSVAQLNVSDGGVPKRPVEVAEVDRRGFVGDRQADRRHHGRPLQALCLWSADQIAALAAEGHPIAAGLAGENVTISGVDWASLRPGARIRIGEVLAELSAWATPCAKNADWFLGRDFHRMDHDRHPGWSRAYAWVLEGGTVRPGDEVVVEP